MINYGNNWTAAESQRAGEEAAEQRIHARHVCTAACGPQWFSSLTDEDLDRLANDGEFEFD